MERTEEYHECCQAAAAALGYRGTLERWAPGAGRLAPAHERSDFTLAALRLHSQVEECRAFMRENQRDFVVAGR